MDQRRRAPARNECWESDRGVRVFVRAVRSGGIVEVELADTALGAFEMAREVFERTFTHLAARQPRLRPSWPPTLAGAH